ncbi:MAG: hypothetical protein AB8B63_10715 [Granulosicoccus sp.]
MISELYLILARLRDEGVTILLVDQMAHMALDIADRAYVLEQGVIVAQGSPEKISSNDVLADAYFGSAQTTPEERAADDAARAKVS